MRRPDKKEWKTGILLTAGALFLLSTTPAVAGFGANGEDNSQLMSRINQLENQIQTLSRSVYKGESRPLPMAGANGAPAGVVYSNDDMVSGSGASSAAGYDDRLGQIEASQRRLTGQIEQMSYDIQQMKAKLNRLSAESTANAYSGQTPRVDNRSYNRQPPGEEDYGGIKSVNSGNGADPRGKILGTLSSPGSGTSSSTPGNQSSSGADNPGTLYDDAFNDIRDARYENAAEKFQRFLKNYSTHPLAANAQYWLAETYYVRQDYKQGARLFAQNYQDYPKSAKASASLLKLGLSLARLGKKDDACLTFTQLKKEFPGDQTPEVQKAEKEMQQLGCK